MTNEEFIRQHREADVRWLALGQVPEGVDRPWCLQQIEGWQTARRKLPRWARTEGLWYGARLAMEQCSGQEAARYKRQLVERLLPEGERDRMADLTGGLGVDFAEMAPLFGEATYVELQPELRRLARHNLPLLGLPGAVVVAPDDFRHSVSRSLVYLDPARRDGVGRKMVGIGDCTPSVLAMQDKLLEGARYVVLKLSPMLDIREALRQLHGVAEVHVVSERGECKELLFVLSADGSRGQGCSEVPAAEDVAVHCVNLGTADAPLTCRMGEGRLLAPLGEAAEGMWLYEPNASVLKAGVQNVLCERCGVRKLHPMSHLYVAPRAVDAFPGRAFRIVGQSDFSKRGLRSLLADVGQANLTVRNFPMSVADLRRRLRLREGGDVFLFATTRADGGHALLRCLRQG